MSLKIRFVPLWRLIAAHHLIAPFPPTLECIISLEKAEKETLMFCKFIETHGRIDCD